MVRLWIILAFRQRLRQFKDCLTTTPDWEQESPSVVARIDFVWGISDRSLHMNFRNN